MMHYSQLNYITVQSFMFISAIVGKWGTLVEMEEEEEDEQLVQGTYHLSQAAKYDILNHS